jgi:hypothetical protein
MSTKAKPRKVISPPETVYRMATGFAFPQPPAGVDRKFPQPELRAKGWMLGMRLSRRRSALVRLAEVMPKDSAEGQDE